MWVRRFGRTVVGILRPGPVAEVLALPALDLGDGLVKLWPGAVLDAGGFRKVFANPAVEVHIPAALPSGVRIGERDRDSEGVGGLAVEHNADRLSAVADSTAWPGKAR
jgi:hypothetical protein